jgi:hypothetical protein
MTFKLTFSTFLEIENLHSPNPDDLDPIKVAASLRRLADRIESDPNPRNSLRLSGENILESELEDRWVLRPATEAGRIRTKADGFEKLISVDPEAILPDQTFSSREIIDLQLVPLPEELWVIPENVAGDPALLTFFSQSGELLGMADLRGGWNDFQWISEDDILTAVGNGWDFSDFAEREIQEGWQAEDHPLALDVNLRIALSLARGPLRAVALEQHRPAVTDLFERMHPGIAAKIEDLSDLPSP